MDTGEISFDKIVIPKAEVSKMPKHTRRQYLMLTNMLRDLNLLQKLLVFAKPDNTLGKISVPVSTTMGFFILKTLISKEYEIWKFIEDERISEKKNGFTRKTRGKLENIENAFNDKKIKELFRFIRNRFGFHYDTRPDIEAEVDKVMTNLPDVEMWLSETSSGNDIFASSNVIMLEVVFHKMRKLGFEGAKEEMMGRLFKLAISIAGFCQEFCTHFLTDVILKDIRAQVKDKITVCVPLLSKVKLPLLVKKDKE